jgi:hypothetical protein
MILMMEETLGAFRTLYRLSVQDLVGSFPRV